MKLVNDTVWRTEDLEALLEFALDKMGGKCSARINKDTILVFTTNRNRLKYDSTTGELVNHCIVEGGYRFDGCDNTITLKVGGPKRMDAEILDRLASVGGSAIQEIPMRHHRLIVRELVELLRGTRWRAPDFDGLERLHFRKERSLPRDTTLLTKRRIETLEREIRDIHFAAQSEIGKRREAINRLRSG